MSLLGLELSDAGIMVAATDPERLLVVDGTRMESPGYALPEKNGLIVGTAAEKQAHLFPRQIMDRFWDQLNTEPLSQRIPHADNHAEVACDHLAHIWETVKHHGKEMVLAVPGFMNREHMGLILGITRELSIPVRGFVSHGAFTAQNNVPEGLLLHLDLHLHRAEVTCLKREKEKLTQQDASSVEGCGINRLFKEWVHTIAEEFVRSTRFDPLHQAASEQELYDRLPGVLELLKRKPSVDFEMTGGSKTYYITLTKELMVQKSAPILAPLNLLIDRMQDQYGHEEPTIILQLAHRLSCLPGVKEALSDKNSRQFIELEPGAGALGVLRYWDPSSHEHMGGGTPFVKSRSLPNVNQANLSASELRASEERPTHILYGHIAYPIAGKPLFIGREKLTDGSMITIGSQNTDVALRHCAVQFQGNFAVLHDYSTSGTFVDASRVSGKVILQLGQTIRLGSSGETLQLIACRSMDER